MEEIQNLINNLVKQVRAKYAFGGVTSKYTCVVHKQFLELVSVDIHLDIQSELLGQSIHSLWKCSECGRVILEAEESMDVALTRGL
jgi:hypothetical protein